MYFSQSASGIVGDTDSKHGGLTSSDHSTSDQKNFLAFELPCEDEASAGFDLGILCVSCGC